MLSRRTRRHCTRKLIKLYIHFFFFFMVYEIRILFFFFFQAEDGIRDWSVTGVQTCALPISHDREPADQERQQRRHDAAEDPEQQREQERERKHLGPRQVLADDLADLRPDDRPTPERDVLIGGELFLEPLHRPLIVGVGIEAGDYVGRFPIVRDPGFVPRLEGGENPRDRGVVPDLTGDVSHLL